MITLYAVRNTVCWDSLEVKRALENVPLADQSRILKYQKNEDKMRALLAVLLSRYALGTALQTPMDEVIIDRDDNGRPFLKRQVKWKGDFNLSHSGDWVVCAITSEGKVGVDTERIDEIDINLFKGVLTRNEMELLTANNGESIPLFYRLWSRKESFVKALGTGLSLPLDNYEFLPTSMKACYQVHQLDEGIVTSWHCKDFHLDKGHSLAVCSDKPPFPESINFLDASELVNPQSAHISKWYRCEC